jgi:glycosyltransferase involved in cell wall biosynthesis
MIDNFKKYILWLPAWYPNKLDAFAGDFLQRHALAVSLKNNLVVIYVIRDKEGNITSSQKVEYRQNGLMEERMIYYYVPKLPLKIFERLLSYIKFQLLYKRAVKELVHERGKPALVHVHVLGRNMEIALWIKKKWNLPFVISEHWTAYLTEAKSGFNQWAGRTKRMWQKAIFYSSGMSVVSDYLGQCISNLAKKRPFDYRVIPNVIDGNLFFPEADESSIGFRLLFISGNEYQKNLTDVIKAMAILRKSKLPFTLDVYGAVESPVQQLISSEGLESIIHLHGMQPYVKIAQAMRKAHAFIMYSRYETFGCVVIEALSSGLPVISSDHPVLLELVKDGENGIIVPGENPHALAKRLEQYIRASPRPDRFQLHKQTNQLYGMARISGLFDNWYKELLTDVLNVNGEDN